MNQHHRTIQLVIESLITEASALTSPFTDEHNCATITAKEVAAVSNAMVHLRDVISAEHKGNCAEIVVDAFGVLGQEVRRHPDLWYFELTLESLAILFADIEGAALTKHERSLKVCQVNELIRRR